MCAAMPRGCLRVLALVSIFPRPIFYPNPWHLVHISMPRTFCKATKKKDNERKQNKGSNKAETEERVQQNNCLTKKKKKWRNLCSLLFFMIYLYIQNKCNWVYYTSISPNDQQSKNLRCVFRAIWNEWRMNWFTWNMYKYPCQPQTWSNYGWLGICLEWPIYSEIYAAANSSLDIETYDFL